jgi:hypothetical protein
MASTSYSPTLSRCRWFAPSTQNDLRQRSEMSDRLVSLSICRKKQSKPQKPQTIYLNGPIYSFCFGMPSDTQVSLTRRLSRPYARNWQSTRHGLAHSRKMARRDCILKTRVELNKCTIEKETFGVITTKLMLKNT